PRRRTRPEGARSTGGVRDPSMRCVSLLVLVLAASVATAGEKTAPLLPHLEQVGPGVWATAYADRHGSTTSGWGAVEGGGILIALPRGIPVPGYLEEVVRVAWKPARVLALPAFRGGDEPVVDACIDAGIRHIHTSTDIERQLRRACKKLDLATLKTIDPGAKV